MKIAGIIAEYNPFHNGHAYQIQKVRQETDADYVIVIMSGDFVQRGEPAVADKYLRTHMALQNGADLVLELPVLFACAGAEYFARGGVSILNSLGCVDILCFGTEKDSLSDFYPVVSVLTEEPESYRATLLSCLKNGMGYPAARSAALSDYLHTDVSFLRHPNNILALEYLCALKKLNSCMIPHTIQRIGAGYHDDTLSSYFSSATAIRQALLRESSSQSDIWKAFMPQSSVVFLEEHLKTYGPLCIQDFSSILQYRLLATHEADDFSSFFDVDQFLANRIFQNRFSFQSFRDFVEVLTSKNQTRGHIQRSLFHILLNICEPDTSDMLLPHYTRILGMKRDASCVLKQIKGSSSIPVLTKMADAPKVINAFAMAENEKKAALSQLQQTTFSSHIYESVLSQKYHQPFRHENIRQIAII